MIRFNTSIGQVTLRFRHNLPSVEVNRNNDLIAMVNNIKIKQGSTECSLEVLEPGDDTPFEYFGQAYTHPTDQYKKETGRELSLKRAIEVAQLTEAQQREIMAGYYAR